MEPDHPLAATQPQVAEPRSREAACADAPERVALGELGDRLSSLRLCKPSADEEIRRSLERHGQLSPVMAFDDRGTLQLVDGFKRLRGAARLGWSSLRVRVLQLEEAAATAIISALHEHRSLTELEEGWIVRSLCRKHRLSQGAVAQLMRRHKSWVSRRLLLVEGLDAVLQTDVRLGLLSPRSAVALAVLPRGNQQQAAELVTGRGMTTRQTEAMVRQLRELDSDEARAQQLAQWPVPSPKVSTELQPPRPRSEDELLLADVTALMQVAVRLEVRLLEAPVSTGRGAVVREALGDLAALLDTLTKAITRARSLQDKVDASTLV